MERTQASSVYAKQSRIAARASFKLSLFLTVAGLFCLAVWGFLWYVKVLLGLALIFVIDTALELGNVRFIHSRRRRVSAAPSGSEFKPNNDLEFISSSEEGAWFERRIIVNGRRLRVQIPPRILSIVRPKADELLASLAELLSKFELFKSLEAQRNPRFAEEIRRLEIARLYFASKKQPNLLEVIFTVQSGGEPWTALWDQDRSEFRDLRLET
jgi:hypothetical protein